MPSKKEFIKIDKLIDLAYELVYKNPDKGIILSRKAYNLSQIIQYDQGIARSKLEEGWCLLVKSDFNKSSKALEISRKTYEILDDKKGIAKVYNALGDLHSSINDNEASLSYNVKALELGREINNSNLITASYINIGKLYLEQNNLESALSYFNKAELKLEKSINNEQMSTCQVYIGNIFEALGNIKKALSYYNKSLVNAKLSNNRVSECKCLTSMGNIYQKMEDFHKSEKSHLESLKISEFLGNKLSKAECLINLGNLFLNTNTPDKAIKLFNNALDLSRSINSQFFEMQTLLGISRYYEFQEMFQDALATYKLFHELNIALNKKDTSEYLENIKIRNKIESVEKETNEERIKNKGLHESFKRVSILNKIGQEITSSLDLEIVMTSIYKNISTFISADLFGIALYNEKRKEIDFKYFIMDGERLPIEKLSVESEGSMAGWVIKNKKTLHINDVKKEYNRYVPKLIGPKNNKTNSLIFVPLFFNDNITGVITIQSYDLNAYTDQHLEIIKAVGAYSAIALENSIVHEEINKLNKIISSEKKELERAYLKIDRLANHDILTGLPNRRLFIELLKQELRQSDRKKTKTAVLFIDLDDFKPVNDSLGHDAGDKVLQMVSQRFISALRESDAIARIGGDEFAAIICNVKNKNDIQKIAEKIINKFKNPFKILESKFQIGISMGISIYPDDDETTDGLLKKADTAMYQIKAENKNSFVFFSEDN